jgi:hypothetical protein
VTAILLRLHITDRPYTFGYFWWPYNVKEVIQHEGFIEVVDTKGTAVVSLADITLRDLYPGEPYP